MGLDLPAAKRKLSFFLLRAVTAVGSLDHEPSRRGLSGSIFVLCLVYMPSNDRGLKSYHFLIRTLVIRHEKILFHTFVHFGYLQK